MRERHWVPWLEDGGTDDTAMDIALLAVDVAPHVGMTPDEYAELLYRQIGWLYQMHMGAEEARG